MSNRQSAYEIGSLVRLRGREWVVLPSSDENLLALKPLTGQEEEGCSIHLDIEGKNLEGATFALPEPDKAGDFLGGKLLRNAARLSLRSGAGPFRSLGKLSVRPRPYQFVPLVMALRLDPVRLLIADDVGVGKTIEGALIAKELLERGEAHRLCVLCPPHLCDQWQAELASKFNIHAHIVRTGTHARLERNTPRHLSIFQYYPYLVASIDFVKSVRHRALFLQHCPDLVIVDEAHTATKPGKRSSVKRQQRHELVAKVAEDASRHLLLLTATPHSGVQESFQSLLGLLDKRFGRMDTASLQEKDRRTLAKHFVQRTRPDVLKWMGVDTQFPVRIEPFEVTYSLSKEYKDLFSDVVTFTERQSKHQA